MDRSVHFRTLLSLMSSEFTMFNLLSNRLQAQIQSIERMEAEMENIGQSNVHNAKALIRKYLLNIRNHIEELHDKQMELENNNQILRTKVHILRQDINDLTIARRKLSPFSSIQSQQIKSNISITSSINPSILTHKNWQFSSLKLAIADSNEMEQISLKLGIKTLPEMVFSNSFLKISYSNSLQIGFDAVNGLRPCIGNVSEDKRVEVQYAKEWKNRAKERSDVERLKYGYDWTYTSDYIGDYQSMSRIEQNVTDRFDMQLLRDQSAPILWSCHCILYEDELSDNGMSQLLVRCRVMPKCFLILLRFWLRVDNVIVRIRDTRLYHEFGHNHVLKHYEEREAKWEDLQRQYPMTQLMQFTDPNVFANKIDVKNSVYDKIFL